MEKIDWGLTVKAAAALAAAYWGGLTPLIQLLLVLMICDIFTGFLAGFVTKQLSSDCSYEGMAKKAIILILVGIASYAEPVVQLPLGQAVAGFYAAHELLSIIENTGNAGVKYPDIIKDALKKLSSEAPEPHG